ncbi:MAG TPA: glycosyltransferase family 39 protein [Phototrophicaceae bacterium]|nr:glycosyltransferase family 39 protein [Phototrophicaceae bacterium]
MRWLALAELAISIALGALLLSSPTTFAYYRFGLLAHLVIAALVFLWARQRQYWLLIIVSMIGLPLALIALPAHFGALDLLLILWTLAALPLISAGLIGREITDGWSNLYRPILIAGISAGCVVNLHSLRDFPNFSATDEAIIFNYIDTLKRTGQVGASLIPYNAPIVTGNLYLDAAALWTDALTDPFALRAFSALGGLLLIAVVFLTARALRDSLTGLIAAALLATNLLWLAVSHVARQEIWLAVFVWGAVWLSLAARKRQSIWLAALAGVIAALSADVHPLGAYACIALGMGWLVEARPSIVGARRAVSLQANRRLFFGFIIGGLIGTVYYVAVHILPNPGYFLAGLRDELVSYGAEGSNPLAAMIARHANYVASNPLEIVLLLIGTIAARRQRRLIVIVGVLIALYTLTVADPNLYYPIIWITGMVILTAWTLRHAQGRWRAPLLAAFLAAFMLNVALIERQVQADWNGRSLAAIEQVAADVPLNQHGLGESFVYLALRDPRFTGFTFVNYWAAGAGVAQWDVVQIIKPDWIVTVRDESAFTPPFNTLSVDVPHMHLPIPDTALAQSYHRIDTLTTSVGIFEIWTRQRF